MTLGLREYLTWQAEMGTDEVVLPRPLPQRPEIRTAALPVTQSAASESRTVEVPVALSGASSLDFFQNLGKTLENKALAADSPPRITPKPPESRNFPVFLGLPDYWDYLEKNRGTLFPGEAGPEGVRPLVRSTGPVQAPLALVGLAPRSADGEAGLAFQGPAGDLLGKMLRAIRLDRQDLYCSTLIKEAVPGRTWSRREIARLLPLLQVELGLAKVSMVLLLGEDCAQSVLKTGKPLEELRQTVHDLDGRQFLVTYHPEELLLREEWKRRAWEDLQWLQKRLPPNSSLPAGAGLPAGPGETR